MSARGFAASVTLVALAGCATPVPLAARGAERLREAPSVAVAWVPSGRPSVDCPTDEGVKTWEYPASERLDPAPGGAPIRWASASAPVVPVAGGTWATIQEQWTRPLATPPVDPAEATARAFLAARREAHDAVRWAEAPVELRGGDPSTLAGRVGGGPVLLLRASRWVLIGCYFQYRPWFNVQAVLVDTGSGEVLWRQHCGEEDPGGWAGEAGPAELAAGGGALYARILEQRAAGCAGWLARELPLARGGEAPATGAGRPR